MVDGCKIDISDVCLSVCKLTSYGDLTRTVDVGAIGVWLVKLALVEGNNLFRLVNSSALKIPSQSVERKLESELLTWESCSYRSHRMELRVDLVVDRPGQ